jgi:hypothetical protein
VGALQALRSIKEAAEPMADTRMIRRLALPGYRVCRQDLDDGRCLRAA